MKSETFQRLIERLFYLELVDKKTIIHLYNWGEPTLNPEIEKIIGIIAEHNLCCGISTNASKYVEINPSLLNSISYLFISMPGFSQKSYDKIHGFDFQKVLDNVERYINYYGPSRVFIPYHLYQFNIEEFPLALNFFSKKKVICLVYAAYFNDFNLAYSFLKGTMDNNTLKKASEQLLLYYVDDLIKKCPVDYTCPQFDKLVIDELENVLTCCVVPKNNRYYSIGSIFDLSSKDIHDKKTHQAICEDCLKSGLAYWMNNTYTPEFVNPIQMHAHLTVLFPKLWNATQKAYSTMANLYISVRFRG